MKNAFNSSTAVLASAVQTALGGMFGQQGRIMTLSTVAGPTRCWPKACAQPRD
jgi:hypothetical protein